MRYQRLNIIGGWLLFVIASAVYISTIEPTASFWDCGEFIATAHKLEVGHPPGAPFFEMIMRLASAFAAPKTVPVIINTVSALCSGATIMFLFWTITHLAKKLIVKETEDGMPSKSQTIAILAAGAIGGLCYTFTDSFWFSAVEGEVYAMSSLFTALVFWAILKWENQADQPQASRWLVLISYLLGLSIGVHLLGLLCIPAITVVYYFRKYKFTTKGFLLTLLLSVIILGFVQEGIVQGTVSVAADFELFFVNTLGMPFNTGVIVLTLLVVGLVIWGLKYTHEHKMKVVNLIILCTSVILIGYSSFAMIVIRSAANPPLDENNPENVFTLLSYLDREQYGSRPLLYGQYFNAPLDPQNPRVDGNPVHMKAWVIENKLGRTITSFNNHFDAEKYLKDHEGKGFKIEDQYIISDDKKNSEYNYDPRFETVFPRMYSSDKQHVQAYKEWSDYVGKPVRVQGDDGRTKIVNVPTFGENLRFFFAYQVDWMYWRYFMWNFAGRQNDVQGHGNLTDGNWLSGVNFVDDQHLGPQENLPPSMKSNKAYNRLFMLPLLLGLIGLIFQLYRRSKDWVVVFFFFVLTGFAIVVYLNQYPFQPRERDYAYVGSFYAFAIWIGLGIYALYDLGRTLSQKQFLTALTYTGGSAAAIYLLELLSGSSHFFSHSIIYLGLVGWGAIALMLLIGKTLKNDKILAVLALLLGLPVPAVMANQEWDDHDRSHRFTSTDFAKDYLDTCAPNAIIFTNGDNDTFPLWYCQEVENYRTDVRVVNLSLLNTDWYINQMKRKYYNSDSVPFSLPEIKYRQGTRDVVILDPSKNPRGVYVNLKDAIDFVANDKNTVQVGVDQFLPYIPSNKFSIPVDKEKVLENGTVAPKDSSKIVDQINWKISRSYVLKNDLMMMDLLAHFDWNRPIYYAVTTGPDSYLNLNDYFSLEGLAYRLVPIKSPQNPNPNLEGKVNTDAMYKNLMDKFKWGGMGSKYNIYMDENNLRMTTNLRLQFSNLADALITEGDTTRAEKVLDKCMNVMPERNVPFNRIMIPIMEDYYEVGANDKANALAERLYQIHSEQLQYFLSLPTEWAAQSSRDMQIDYMVSQRIIQDVTRTYPQKALGDSLSKGFQDIQMDYAKKLQDIDRYNKTIKANF